ncbi:MULTISPECIES: HEAT repeat domain-containing protein [Arenibacter]|uniref:HEAT repeat domain-containing protein n=1 Tax=Arenibacter TaxID=178469 RepID=UPI001EFDBEED|nr:MULTISPECIES: HEAT repeat domain-containing protein [Arenibacter]
MTIEELFQEKSIKAKAKAKELCQWLVNGELPPDKLLNFAENQSPINKATCIESVECATKKTTDIADEPLLECMTNALINDEPRVKWESAKIIGNIAKKSPNSLHKPTKNLLINTNNKGAVVRWATAYAFGKY